MPYIKTNWKDLPDVSTPINAARLNKLETQYDQAMLDAGTQIDSALDESKSYTDQEILRTQPTAQAIAQAIAAADRAEDARDQAEVFAAGTQMLQDAAVAALVATPESATQTQLNSMFAEVKSVQSKPYGDGTTDATAHIQNVIDAANIQGIGVYVPAGTYKLTAPLEDVRRLHLADGAVLRAEAAGMAAVVRTRMGTRLDDGSITGEGVIDAGSNAAIGIHLRDFLYFEVSGVTVHGGTTAAVKAGQTGSSGRSAEAILSNLRIYNPSTVSAGSRGVLVENSGDHSFSQLLIQNYEYGVTLPAAGNAVVHDVHVWTEPAKGSTKVSFEDSSNNSHYSGCHADTPTEYGWRLFGYQTTLSQCGTYNNHNNANSTDNVMVGIKLEAANPIATIIGHYFLGGSVTKRLKADIEAADGNYGLVQHAGCSNQNTATVRTLYNRSIGHVIRDTVSAGLGFSADAKTPTGNLGLSIKTNGLDRWKIVSDGGAETGSNAGSGLAIRRYDDAGALLSEVLFINRSSGTVVLKSALSIEDGKNIILGAATGTRIGTNAAQKLSFYGLPPVVQPSNTPADATDLATALTLVNNLKAKLMTLGLIV